MPLAYELTWVDRDYDTLKNNVRLYNNAYESLTEQLATNRERVEDYQQWGERINHLLEQEIPDKPHSALFRSNVRNNIRFNVNDAQNALDSIRIRLDGTAENLSTAIERLRRYPPDFTGQQRMTKQEVVQALTGLPNFKPGSVTTRYLYDRPVVEWQLTGIYLRPDGNPYPWLRGLGAGNIPTIPLQDIQARIELTNGSIALQPLRNQHDQALYSWDGTRTVHPHILSNHEPCLGDFAGPVREAIHERDWVSVHTFLRLFLERAIIEDSAGARWARPFSQSLPGLRLLTCWPHITRIDNPEVYVFFVETEVGKYELHQRTSGEFTEGNLISTTPLKLKGGIFREAATI